MSSPFSPLHECLLLIAAVVALGIGGWNLLQAFHPQRPRKEFRLAPISQGLLLLLFATLPVLVIFAFPVVARYGIWLPLIAVVGLTIQRLALEYDERKPESMGARTNTAPHIGTVPESPPPSSASVHIPRGGPVLLLWAAVALGAGWLIVELRQTYLALAVGVSFFLLFVVPAKDRPTVAKLFGIVAVWGIPALQLGMRVAQFVILSALYGVGPVWNESIAVTRMPRNAWFIQLSNGDQFHDVQVFFWRFATFILVALFAALWLMLLVALSKRLYPPWHAAACRCWQEYRKSRRVTTA